MSIIRSSRWASNWRRRMASAWPLGVLLLALSALFLVPKDRGYFYPFHIANGMEKITLAQSFSLQRGFLYKQLTRRADGTLKYRPYHRFPVTGYALMKLVVTPFSQGLSAPIEAARALMLGFWCGAAVLAYLALARLTRNRPLALLATLLAFASHHMLLFADSLSNEVAMDLCGVMLAFHGMVVFEQSGRRRFGQLVTKTCVALLFGWHVYALVGPFVLLGLAAGALATWRRANIGSEPAGAKAAGAIGCRSVVLLGRGVLRSRHVLLGVVAVLFGAGVLGGNLALERAALGGERPLMELSTVRSALVRTGIAGLGRPSRPSDEAEGESFLKWQLHRVGAMALPFLAYGPFGGIEARLLEGEDAWRGRGWPSLSGVGLVATLLTVGLLCSGLYLRVLAPLASCGFCWAWAVRGNTGIGAHDFESVFYCGVPLVGYLLVPLLLARAAKRRFWMPPSARGRLAEFIHARWRWTGGGAALCASLMFVISHARLVEQRQYPRHATAQRELMTEFERIHEQVGARDLLVCRSEWPAVDFPTYGGPTTMWHAMDFYHYAIAGPVLWYPARLRGAEFWRRRGGPNRVLCPVRVDVPSLRTPTHRHVFFYDSLDAVDAIARVWRREYDRVSATPRVWQSEWDLHWAGGTLAYLKNPCADADVAGHFTLLAQGADASTRGAGGFESRHVSVRHHMRRFDNRCMMRIPMVNPARVRAAFASSDGVGRWRAAFRLDHDALRVIRAATFGLVSTPALEGAGFLVRRHGDALVYLRSPCDPADVEARFFLHVTPVSAAALPAARLDAGFDNLDFAFGEHGAVVDGACVAEVPLPDYAVAEIRTGQFAGGVEAWATRPAIGGAGRRRARKGGP